MSGSYAETLFRRQWLDTETFWSVSSVLSGFGIVSNVFCLSQISFRYGYFVFSNLRYPLRKTKLALVDNASRHPAISPRTLSALRMAFIDVSLLDPDIGMCCTRVPVCFVACTLLLGGTFLLLLIRYFAHPLLRSLVTSAYLLTTLNIGKSRTCSRVFAIGNVRSWKCSS